MAQQYEQKITMIHEQFPVAAALMAKANKDYSNSWINQPNTESSFSVTTKWKKKYRVMLMKAP